MHHLIKFYLWLIVFLLTPAARAGVVDGNVIMDQSMGENLCALTFDDGPSRNTPQLLDMLKEYHIPATFFLLGSQASHNPDIVARIIAEGHEVGNHSWSHPNLKHLSTSRILEEIMATDELLRSLGAAPLYMRPPYGSYDERAVKIVNDMGMSLVLWSLDSRDWQHLPEDYAQLVSTRGTIYDQGALRGIFLFHDTRKTTVEDLPRIIANLKAGGCDRFVTVSDYLAGILDPEPCLVLTRGRAPEKRVAPTLARKRDLVPLARCSKPWGSQAGKLELEDAHAQAAGAPAGM